ncbi:MAG TPA: hypothetical protein VJ878_03575, partial [Candidatus Izemoplasmatales bacterium]|nr:hypothetical protein [Candidatus Izemoplasmatales bacterium]
MAWTPTIGDDGRATAQTNLLDGINSRRGFAFNEEINELEKDKTQFISMLMAYNRKAVNDPDHKYQEHRPAWLDGRKFYMGTALSTSAANSGDAFANTAVEKTAGG